MYKKCGAVTGTAKRVLFKLSVIKTACALTLSLAGEQIIIGDALAFSPVLKGEIQNYMVKSREILVGNVQTYAV